MVATIVSSQYTGTVVQHDGRISVDELHTDSLGVGWVISKFVDGSTDLAAMLPADANDLLTRLGNDEIAGNVRSVMVDGSPAVLTFNYSTQGQGLNALRAAYQGATRTEAVMIGDFLASLTNTQLMNIFNMNTTQVQNLRANKLTPAATTAQQIRAAQGQ